MSENKSELRQSATTLKVIVASIIVVAIAAFLILAYAPKPFSKPDASKDEKASAILAFAQSKFIDGKFVEGFAVGAPDYGISLEMLLARYALGDRSEGFTVASDYLLSDDGMAGSIADDAGYLWTQNADESVTINPALVGKWAFVSAALEIKNEKNRTAMLQAAADYAIANPTTQSDFQLAWLVLGLDAANLAAEEIQVAKLLVASQNSDGGFDDYEPGTSTTDGTALSLLALAGASDDAPGSDKAAIDKAEASAQSLLVSTVSTSGAYWEAYGAANTNGTAYAYMALKSSLPSGDPNQELVSKINTWLRSQVVADGGVQAGFAPGAGDNMASSQAIIPVLGYSYLDYVAP